MSDSKELNLRNRNLTHEEDTNVCVAPSVCEPNVNASLYYKESDVLSKQYRTGKRFTSNQLSHLDDSSELQKKVGIENNYEHGVKYAESTAPTYALQVALKNMKERYEKLQKKITVLEQENVTLIHGKTELFGEIGKMQESSIKLREKNLKLNHEVHSQHTECCSLKDKFLSLNEDNLQLNNTMSKIKLDKRRMMRHVDCLDKKNEMLKNSLLQAIEYCKDLPNISMELLNDWQILAKSTKRLSDDQLDEWERREKMFEDMENVSHGRRMSRTKIVPSLSHLHSFDEIEQIAEGMGNLLDESCSKEGGGDTSHFGSLERVTEDMAKAVEILRTQKSDLTHLQALVSTMRNKYENKCSEKEHEYIRDGFCISQLATYGSGIPPSKRLLSSASNIELSPPINDSGGETRILIDRENSDKRSSFDWTKLKGFDDEPIADIPEMRDTSTSPDMTLCCDGSAMQRIDSSSLDDEERKCPMCYAIFPMNVIPIDTFEQHVINHFEQENGFEVLS